MDLFEGYEMISNESGETFMSISASGITFSKAAVTKLSSPLFVTMWINKEKKMLLLTPAQNGDSDYSFRFSRNENCRDGVLMHRRILQKKIFDILGVKQDEMEGNIYIDGEYFSTENAIQFDAKKAYMK